MKKILTLVILFTSVRVFAQPCIPNTSSLSFNGTSANYVSFTTQTNLNPTNALTVEAWVYPAAWGITRSDGSIFCKHSWTSVSGESGYVLRAGANGILSLNIGGDSLGLGTSVHWKEVFTQPGALSLNTWSHVAGTFDGTHLKLYINGVLAADSLFTGTIKPSSFPPKISRLSDNGVAASRFWNGKIDEVRVFNHALSQTEISDSMSVHIDPAAQTGLVGYWRMNENTGVVMNDLSTSGNSGTVAGAAWSALVPFNDAPPMPVISFIGGQLIVNTCPNYQWFLGTTLLSGATHQTYLPTQNGIYTVVDTSVTCRITSAPYNLTALSVEENISDHLISLTPNPSHDFIFVHLENYSSLSRVDITDVTGRKLFHQSTITSPEFKISVERFAKGIYFARFYGNNEVLTKKFVVE